MPLLHNYYSGQVYSNRMLTGKSFQNEKARKMVEVICECGTIKFMMLCDLKDLKDGQKSCGCSRVNHGMSKNPLYSIWRGVKSRCYIKSDGSYHNYGGAGITMCTEWLSNFITFHDWAISNGWKKGLTIDRIDNSKGYSPENCRWATVAEQNRNQRRNVNVTAFGETKCIAAWAKDSRVSLTESCIINRIRKLGWNAEKALTAPHIDRESNVKKNNVILEIFGEKKCIAAWSRDERCAVSKYIFKYRIKRNWEPYLALTHII